MLAGALRASLEVGTNLTILSALLPGNVAGIQRNCPEVGMWEVGSSIGVCWRLQASDGLPKQSSRTVGQFRDSGLARFMGSMVP